MSLELKAWRAARRGVQSHACNCIGPQDGDPLCPCMMRDVVVKDGRYVQTIDYGPVQPEVPKTPKCAGCGRAVLEIWAYCPHCGAQDRT